MSKVNPSNMVYASLIQELEEWKERALTAERECRNLERKLRGERKRNDPREKFKRKFST